MSDLFTAVSPGRISAEIVGRIKGAIRDGTLAPGDQLPPERDLIKQLGVSRVSVRDALRMLEATGLVEVRVGARGGAFVTAPAPVLVGEGLADMLMLADVTPAEVTEARMVFEVGALGLICERAQESDFEALDEICDRADAALAAGLYDPALSTEFHTRLAAAAHNKAIALFAESFQGLLRISLQYAQRADSEVGRMGALEHRALVSAIRERDGDAARAILTEHLARTARRVAPTRRRAD